MAYKILLTAVYVRLWFSVVYRFGYVSRARFLIQKMALVMIQFTGAKEGFSGLLLLGLLLWFRADSEVSTVVMIS